MSQDTPPRVAKTISISHARYTSLKIYLNNPTTCHPEEARDAKQYLMDLSRMGYEVDVKTLAEQGVVYSKFAKDELGGFHCYTNPLPVFIK